MEKQAKKKILLIRTSSLGDVIFNIPLANRLKDNGYEVSWLVGDKGVQVIQNNSCVDECIFVPLKKWKKHDIFKIILNHIKLIQYIRSKRFDIAIDTQGLLFKSGIFLLFSGAKRRIISSKAREFSFLCANEIINNNYIEEEKNVVKKYLKYADYLNIDETNLKYTLPIPSKELQKKIDIILNQLDDSKPIVVICPATTWIGKHWDRDNWKNLIAKIETQYSLIYTGTKNDIDLIEYISCGKGLNLAGKTNLLELAELFRRAALVISLDSGSTHLARATNVPRIVSIFCCTPTELYAPLGSNEKYISVASQTCKPCHKRKCKLKTGKYKCTLSPSVEEVYQVIQKML